MSPLSIQTLLTYLVWGVRRRQQTLTDSSKAVTDQQDQVDQHTICWTFDFKVPEQRVGPEQVQSFGDDIVSTWISCSKATGQAWPWCKVSLEELNPLAAPCSPGCGAGPRILLLKGSKAMLPINR